MVGLVSVGAYGPRYRLTGALLREAWGGAGDGERALANYDEDSLTMACEAALAALTGRDVSRVGACFLASTSAPYAEKSTATLLASVCDLAPDAITADLGGSLRCGTTALRLAPPRGDRRSPRQDRAEEERHHAARPRRARRPAARRARPAARLRGGGAEGAAHCQGGQYRLGRGPARARGGARERAAAGPDPRRLLRRRRRGPPLPGHGRDHRLSSRLAAPRPARPRATARPLR